MMKIVRARHIYQEMIMGFVITSIASDKRSYLRPNSKSLQYFSNYGKRAIFCVIFCRLFALG
jgi:hypothetical protein